MEGNTKLVQGSTCLTDYVFPSIGNYFISGAQTFFRSLPSAIFLFASITNSQVCPTLGMWLCHRLTGYVKANILPVIVTNHTVTIAAELVSLVLKPG